MLSTKTTSRRTQQTQKPIIHAREPSTDSRSSYSSHSSTYSSSSTFSDMSRSNASSTRSSERSFQEPRVQFFRAPDSVGYRGNFVYSADDRVKVINHNAQSVEPDLRLRSSRATHEDYARTQQRSDRNRPHQL